MTHGILFDMDGLMFDTEPAAQWAWMEAGKEQGADITEAFVASIRGTTMENCRQRFLDAFGQGFDIDAAAKRRTQLLMEKITREGLPVKEGLLDLLAWLKDHGYQTAMATSTARPQVEVYLDMAGIRQYFDVVITGDMVTRGKPDPEIFLLAAERLRLKPEECLVLEDSANGILAACSGGIPVICIPDMDQHPEGLLRKTAAVLPDLRQVIGYLKGALS